MDPSDYGRQWLGPTDKVKVSTLYALLGRARRFSELARLTGVSNDHQLTQALKVLLSADLVDRIVVAKGPQGIRYEITSAGIEAWNEWYFLNRLSTHYAAEGLIEKERATVSDETPTVTHSVSKQEGRTTISLEEAMHR